MCAGRRRRWRRRWRRGRTVFFFFLVKGRERPRRPETGKVRETRARVCARSFARGKRELERKLPSHCGICIQSAKLERFKEKTPAKTNSRCRRICSATRKSTTSVKCFTLNHKNWAASFCQPENIVKPVQFTSPTVCLSLDACLRDAESHAAVAVVGLIAFCLLPRDPPWHGPWQSRLSEKNSCALSKSRYNFLINNNDKKEMLVHH